MNVKVFEQSVVSVIGIAILGAFYATYSVAFYRGISAGTGA